MPPPNLPAPDFTFDPNAPAACIAGVRPFCVGSYWLEAETSGSKFIVHKRPRRRRHLELWLRRQGRRSCENTGASSHDTRVAVLGAGVMGMTAASRLLDLSLGLTVTIYAKEVWQNTTSAVAGGQWAVSKVNFKKDAGWRSPARSGPSARPTSRSTWGTRSSTDFLVTLGDPGAERVRPHGRNLRWQGADQDRRQAECRDQHARCRARDRGRQGAAQAGAARRNSGGAGAGVGPTHLPTGVRAHRRRPRRHAACHPRHLPRRLFRQRPAGEGARRFSLQLRVGLDRAFGRRRGRCVLRLRAPVAATAAFT